MVLYCKDKLLNVIKAENDPEIISIRKHVFNRFVDIGIFVEGFDNNLKAIVAKIPERKQLNIVNVRLDIGY